MDNAHEELLRFWLIEPALVLAPLSIPIGRMLSRRLQIKSLFCVFIILLVSIGALCFTAFGPWSLRSAIANTALGSASYIVVMVILYALVSLPSRRWIRRSFYAVLLIPVLISFFLGTVGFLGLMFLIQDSVPRQETMLNSEYGYRIYFTGNALASTHTAELDVVKCPRFLPIQKTVWHRSFDAREYEYHGGVRVALSPDGQQILVTLQKQGGGEAVEHFLLR